MQTARIEIPIFHGDLVLSIISTEKEFKKLLKEFKIKRFDPNFIFDNSSAWTYDERDSNGYTQYFFFFKSDKIRNCSKFHECGHITGKIMRDRNIPYSFENDETFCYLLGWVGEKVHEFLMICK